mmetsp:Transcript_22144/g.44426  ORF Transcript_22144/g.44426 Transcript_22144/m.44426 type:complete len:87 (+) Transcript_22144:65-325(+)
MPFGNEAWRTAHHLYRFDYKCAWPGFRLGVGAFFVAWGAESAYNLISGKKGGHGHGHEDHGHGHATHHTKAVWTTVIGEPPVLADE